MRSNHNTSDHNPKAGFVITQVAQKFFRKRFSFPPHRRGVKVHIPWTVSNGKLYPTNYLTAHTFAQYFSWGLEDFQLENLQSKWEPGCFVSFPLGITKQPLEQPGIRPLKWEATSFRIPVAVLPCAQAFPVSPLSQAITTQALSVLPASSGWGLESQGYRFCLVLDKHASLGIWHSAGTLNVFRAELDRMHESRGFYQWYIKRQKIISVGENV